MKIAIFYPVNVIASWYTLGGYVRCLKRMGHEVVDVPLPGNCYDKMQRKVVEVSYIPTIDELNSCDVVLLTFLEHINGWMELLYGRQWERVKVPVIARFDESFDRRDLQLPDRWPELKKWANYYSFPAAQDARRFGGQWLPYGADFFMFNQQTLWHRKYDVAFIGTVYGVRFTFLQNLAPYLGQIKIKTGNVFIQDLGGYRFQEQTELLAQNYGQIKVFLCLPPMSQLLVAKVFEAMSCGTFMMYPKLRGEAAENMSLFEDGKEIVYYDPNNLKETANLIRYYLDMAQYDEREKIAETGMKKVQTQYSLCQMFEKLLALA